MPRCSILKHEAGPETRKAVFSLCGVGPALRQPPIAQSAPLEILADIGPARVQFSVRDLRAVGASELAQQVGPLFQARDPGQGHIQRAGKVRVEKVGVEKVRGEKVGVEIVIEPLERLTQLAFRGEQGFQLFFQLSVVPQANCSLAQLETQQG